MTNLLDHLKLKPNSTVLDLACGKGRHSIFLNKKGLDVTGVDLSAKSIEFAKNFENVNLRFDVHDMREKLNNKFDAIFNLFTSFGYFEDVNDNIAVLETIKNSMKPNSVAVIDFMNAEKVVCKLVGSEIQKRGDIDFEIHRFVKDNIIHKNIKFKDNDVKYDFTEKVQAIKLSNFESCISKVELKLVKTFGNYNLEEFDVNSSDRLILILTK